MEEQRYNKRVRQAISDKYVEYSKMYADAHKEFLEAESRLKGENAKKNLSYEQYVDLEKYLNNLKEEMKVLRIQIDISWQIEDMKLQEKSKQKQYHQQEGKQERLLIELSMVR